MQSIRSIQAADATHSPRKAHKSVHTYKDTTSGNSKVHRFHALLSGSGLAGLVERCHGKRHHAEEVTFSPAGSRSVARISLQHCLKSSHFDEIHCRGSVSQERDKVHAMSINTQKQDRATRIRVRSLSDRKHMRRKASEKNTILTRAIVLEAAERCPKNIKVLTRTLTTHTGGNKVLPMPRDHAFDGPNSIGMHAAKTSEMVYKFQKRILTASPTPTFSLLL